MYVNLLKCIIAYIFQTWHLYLQEANAGFRMLLSRSTQQLKTLAKKLGSCIDKSRPYYDALEEYKVQNNILHFSLSC